MERQENTHPTQALQLLEFLIKNGSERVVDDARSHLSLLKMLRQFHFIDQNGKDQGVNVRNRSKELAELLSDVDRIRAERKKARTNRNKFGGVEGGAMGSGLSSSSKYGGFGSEDTGTYGGYSGGVYGDGGGFGGNTTGFQDSASRRDRFEEYDEYDEGVVASPARRKPGTTLESSVKREQKKVEPPKKKEPEIDILGFDDDELPPKTPPKEPPLNGKKAIPNAMDDDFGAIQSSNAGDDDFDDFQSALPAVQPSQPSIPGLPLPFPLGATSAASNLQSSAPKPGPFSQGAGLNDLVGFSSTTNMTSQPVSSFASQPLNPIQPQPPSRPSGYQATQPNYFTSVPAVSATSTTPSNQPFSSNLTFNKPGAAQSTSSAKSGGDAFGSLWSTASASAGIKKPVNPGSQGPNLASMAKEKANAGIWGATPPARNGGPRPGNSGKTGGGLDDLLG